MIKAMILVCLHSKILQFSRYSQRQDAKILPPVVPSKLTANAGACRNWLGIDCQGVLPGAVYVGEQVWRPLGPAILMPPPLVPSAPVESVGRRVVGVVVLKGPQHPLGRSPGHQQWA
jgi:hypothetical protein